MATSNPVRLWRLVAGAFLHFGILAYLVAVPLACLLTAPRGATWEQVARLGLGYSGWFLLALLASGVVATAIAALVDGASGRRRPDEATASARRLADAARLARSLPEPLRAALTAMTSRPWPHAEHEAQALSRDLLRTVETATAARLAAPVERHAALDARLRESLAHIDAAFADLQHARAAASEDAARATALYVERRYGASDFATKPD